MYFSDFECEYCRVQEQAIKEIVQNYKYKTKFIWKDYPENNVLSPSFQAAIAARCAQAQDKFWPFHDWLYEYHKGLERDIFIEIAGLVELDIDEFSECLDSDEPKQRVFDNMFEANALDITGIPFIYINNQEVMGQISYEDLEKLVKIELESD